MATSISVATKLIYVRQQLTALARVYMANGSEVDYLRVTPAVHLLLIEAPPEIQLRNYGFDAIADDIFLTVDCRRFRLIL